MGIKIKRSMPAIQLRITAGKEMTIPEVTEAVIEYGNIFVRKDQGALEASSLIKSRPQEGVAIWDTPYAKKMYYAGTPSKDVNSNASLMWAEKGVKTYKKELDQIAQNAFTKGMDTK